MVFDDDLRGDTPMGLLRGIKYGTESYHVLFKRLCSYAGLHCVVIKGYSKSAGYQPGVKFQDSRFDLFSHFSLSSLSQTISLLSIFN
jgi:hypothetical protein